MKSKLMYLLVAIATCAFIYGSYWFYKNASYWIWYEDMVKATIREMVKQEALKGG